MLEPARVLVVGAGIAGLAAATALRAGGAEVRVVERAASYPSGGAGLLLAANAVAAARALGVEVADAACATTSARISDAQGRLIQETPFTRTAGAPPTYALHRRVLTERLAERVGAQHVRFGLTVEALVDAGSGVDVRFSDGQLARFDLVIGADGIRSSIRSLRMGDAAPPVVYSGYTCWRFICANVGINTFEERWGRGRRVGFAPIDADRVYVFLVSNAAARAEAPKWPDGVRGLFADFAPPVPQLLAAAVDGESPLRHDLEDLARPVWGDARAWLIGDAAHAMLPNLGQGAAMALEDALALSQALGASGAGSLSDAHASFVAMRARRVKRLWRQSRQLGDVAQWSGPTACWLRDSLARLMPAAVARRSQAALIEPGLALASEFSKSSGFHEPEDARLS